MIEALDVVIMVNGSELLTVISVERGITPNRFFCVDSNGCGDWFEEQDIRIARTADLKQVNNN